MGGATQHQAPPPALSLCFIVNNSLQPPSFRVTLLSRPLAARIPLAAEETSSADLGWGGDPCLPCSLGLLPALQVVPFFLPAPQNKSPQACLLPSEIPQPLLFPSQKELSLSLGTFTKNAHKRKYQVQKHLIK